MSRSQRFGALVVLFVLVSGGTAAAVMYGPPVDAPVVDAFRAPKTPYGPGNRGWEYKSEAGAPVRVAAPGVVAFAGQVGGVLNVVVEHDDGIRTTYSHLRSIAVKKGQSLAEGAVVGEAGPSTYFGARCGKQYIDPKGLFDVRVYLVPLDGKGGVETGPCR